LEVIMSNQPGASRKRPLSNVFLHSPVRFVYETVIDPMRRRARGRADAWQLARLDDHLLRDYRPGPSAGSCGRIRPDRAGPAFASGHCASPPAGTGQRRPPATPRRRGTRR
jgi:hypothetical protein